MAKVVVKQRGDTPEFRPGDVVTSNIGDTVGVGIIYQDVNNKNSMRVA